jgi:hypothetical protein
MTVVIASSPARIDGGRSAVAVGDGRPAFWYSSRLNCRDHCSRVQFRRRYYSPSPRAPGTTLSIRASTWRARASVSISGSSGRTNCCCATLLERRSEVARCGSDAVEQRQTFHGQRVLVSVLVLGARCPFAPLQKLHSDLVFCRAFF